MVDKESPKIIDEFNNNTNDDNDNNNGGFDMNLANEQYSKKEFWNDRFEKTGGTFDWYADWAQLKSHYNKLIQKEDSILMMSEQMYIDGYINITNIDISNVVIEQMNTAHSINYPKVKYIEMDATAMSFESNAFNCVIDKGTLDALMCSDSHDIPSKLINEMYRVTKVNGYFTFITHGEPNHRLPFFEQYLPKESYEVNHEKVNLSFMSNLINSIRNSSKDHSIKSGVQDKNVLIASILDAFVNTYQDSELTEDQRKAKKKAALQLKLQAFINKHENKKKNNSNEEGDSNEKDNDSNKSGVTSKNSIRRTNCNLYVIKKLK